MKTILLIEDNPIIRLSVSNLLRLRGFNVIEAKTGKVGLQLAKEQPPDLILSDINIPQLDGYGVLEELRKDLITAKVPFIFVTAYECTPMCRCALQLGANDWITKPVNNDELLKAIAIQLDKR